jgi:hypothetical protein
MADKKKQEYDYEGDMAMSQLKSIIANAQRMHDMLEVDTNLPEWVQSKITLAEDYITTAANYMQGEMSEDVVRVGTLAQRTQAYRADKAKKAGANLKMDPDTGTPDHFTSAARRKKGLPEDVAVNSAGAGNIAGIGVGPDGEPGVKKKKKNVMSFNRFMKK